MRSFMRFIIALLVLLPLIGRAALPMAEDVKMKAELERSIGDHYTELIATRLPRSEFQVSAVVKLEKKIIAAPHVAAAKPVAASPTAPVNPTPVAAAVEKKDADLHPLELSLGLINADSLLATQQREIDRLRDQSANREPASRNEIIQLQPIINFPDNRAPAPDVVQYRVSKVSLSVGLSSEFPPEYVAQFREWLDRQVANEFDNTGRAEISTLRAVVKKPEPIAPKKEEPAPKKEEPIAKTAPKEVPRTWLNEAQGLQNFLGLAAMALAFLAGVMIWRSTKQDVTTPEQQISVNIDPAAVPEKTTNDLAPAVEAKTLPQALAASPSDKQILTRLNSEKRKVRSLAEEVDDRLSGLVRSWVEGGAEGQYKCAVFIDALTLENGPTTDWELSIPPEYNEIMSKIFRNMSNASIESRLSTIENVYWDLISLKTLQELPVSQRFAFLTALDHELLADWFMDADASTRGLVMMFLPDETRQDLFKLVDPAVRHETLQASLEWQRASVEELDKAERQVQNSIKKAPGQQRVPVLQEKLYTLLSSLSLLEEMRWWPRLVDSLPDHGRGLRYQKPSLAFINEWSFDARKTFSREIAFSDLHLLIRLRPEFETSLLEVCPPRFIEMFKSEGDAGRSPVSEAEEAQVEADLIQLQTRLVRMVDNRMIRRDDLVPRKERHLAVA